MHSQIVMRDGTLPFPCADDFSSSQEVIQAAKAHRIDKTFSAQKTPERPECLLFSKACIEMPNMIAVRKDRQGGSGPEAIKG